MTRLTIAMGIVVAGLLAVFHATAEDRVVSIGESPGSAVEDANGGHGMLLDLVRALDKATHSSTKIVLRPFARSLSETAAGKADFHIPLIQNDDSPAPKGLAYVTEVDFGEVQFVIYSRKLAPLDAKALAQHKIIETEPDHESFFPFPVKVTYCVPCSLDQVLLGRIDALVVPADIVDPLLNNPKYEGIHRALYKLYPVRALVPVNRDSTEVRRYLIEGVAQLKRSGELWKITHHNLPYSNWQP